MSKGHKILAAACMFLVCLAAALAVPQAAAQSPVFSAPLELLRPQSGGEPVFPQDYVIGKLGRGSASEESYRYARAVTASLAAGNGKTAQVLFPEQKRLAVLKSLSPLSVRGWRIGGGRLEGDGSVSFLVRFLGREQGITGELYLRQEKPTAAAAVERTPDMAETQAVDAAGTNTLMAEAIETSESTSTETAPPGKAAATGVETKTSVRWRVDDMLLEPPRSLAGGTFSPGGADMTPYERFF